MQRKPGETVLELAARIGQTAATCDFSAIEDPLDKTLRTRFICSINNEAVLKALFKVKDNELTFSRAIEIAVETEDAAKVAKETVFGSKLQPVSKVNVQKLKPKSAVVTSKDSSKSKVKCYRCGNAIHVATDYRFKDAICNYCKITGHLEKVCRKKAQHSKSSVKSIRLLEVNSIPDRCTSVPKLEVAIAVNDTNVAVELDTAAADNFLSLQDWERLGRPSLSEVKCKFQSASKHILSVRGSFQAITSSGASTTSLVFLVTKVPGVNLLGRDAMKALEIFVDDFLFSRALAIAVSSKVDGDLQTACSKLCDEYAELFKSELGCLRDVELEIEFKSEATPIFMKPRPVPFAIQQNLARAYETGISRGIWTPTPFNNWGTPVKPVRKSPLPGNNKPRLRVRGDYSVTVNPQLAVHRHPLPWPEELMRKLGGYQFTKIDLAEAYNQVQLGPESRRRLALSTHRRVLLQNVLPFGISSAPGYFQKIMDDLTNDLPGVAVYLDNILVSGKDAEDHLRNLRKLLDCLHFQNSFSKRNC